MANVERLKRRKRVRARRMRRQWKKYEATGKQGHLKAFRLHRRAVRKLARLIDRASRPSPNFSYAEFNTKDGTPVPKAAYKGLDHLCQNYLEPLRKKFGPVSITSGYRHSRYNAAVGGVSNSLHVYDAAGRDGSAVAADVVCARGNPYEWAQFLDSLGAAGVGTYPRHGFVHVDNRDRMGWPTSRWTG